jgi:hypothetical protein
MENAYLKIQALDGRDIACENMNWFSIISVESSGSSLLIFQNKCNVQKHRRCNEGRWGCIKESLLHGTHSELRQCLCMKIGKYAGYVTGMVNSCSIRC